VARFDINRLMSLLALNVGSASAHMPGGLAGKSFSGPMFSAIGEAGADAGVRKVHEPIEAAQALIGAGANAFGGTNTQPMGGQSRSGINPALLDYLMKYMRPR